MTDFAAEAARLDAADPLARWRAEFLLDKGVAYLDGNSLGALPRKTPERLAEVVRQEWGEGLIGSWNSANWIGLPQKLGGMIAPLIGAERHEVCSPRSTRDSRSWPRSSIVIALSTMR